MPRAMHEDITVINGVATAGAGENWNKFVIMTISCLIQVAPIVS